MVPERRFIIDGYVYVERDGQLRRLGRAASFEAAGLPRPPIKLPGYTPKQIADYLAGKRKPDADDRP